MLNSLALVLDTPLGLSPKTFPLQPSAVFVTLGMEKTRFLKILRILALCKDNKVTEDPPG